LVLEAAAQCDCFPKKRVTLRAVAAHCRKYAKPLQRYGLLVRQFVLTGHLQ
jgi:hypothetical protein